MSDQLDEVRPVADTIDHHSIQTINPATGEPGRSYHEHSHRRRARRRRRRARGIPEPGGGRPSPSAPRVMREAAAILRERKDEFAGADDRGDGQDRSTDGRAEVEKCAFHCDCFAEHAEGYLAPRAGRHRRRRRRSSPSTRSASCWR